MKALLDRLVYGMNKYYGTEKGPALLEGKSAASVVTCGYPPEKGADLWEDGIKRYCKHSRLSYLGMLTELLKFRSMIVAAVPMLIIYPSFTSPTARPRP